LYRSCHDPCAIGCTKSRKVFANRSDCAWILVDEEGEGGSPRQGFEAERAAAGVKICHPEAFE
jgi:hypothetical protein